MKKDCNIISSIHHHQQQHQHQHQHPNGRQREREREREDREGLSDHFRSDGQKGLFVKFPNLNWLSQEEEKEKKGVRLSLYIHTYIHTYYTYHTYIRI